MLIPAAFVALLVLAALAFDQSLLFAARRELVDVASSAANDAAAFALDGSAYRRGEGPALSRERAADAVARSLAERGLSDRVTARVEVTGAGDQLRVVVYLERRVPAVFARLAPGGYRSTPVRVVASASLSPF